MTDHIRIANEAAAAKVAEIFARPMPEDREVMGCEGDFDPWDIFPTLYGSYSSAFDKLAVEVLTDILHNRVNRDDLAGEMLREMLCTARLCDYGTSPRVCFPTQEFRALLPALIDKWAAYATLAWGDGWDKD